MRGNYIDAVYSTAMLVNYKFNSLCAGTFGLIISIIKCL